MTTRGGPQGPTSGRLGGPRADGFSKLNATRGAEQDDRVETGATSGSAEQVRQLGDRPDAPGVPIGTWELDTARPLSEAGAIRQPGGRWPRLRLAWGRNGTDRTG